MKISQRMASNLCAVAFTTIVAVFSAEALHAPEATCNSSIWLTDDGWQISCAGDCSCVPDTPAGS